MFSPRFISSKSGLACAAFFAIVMPAAARASCIFLPNRQAIEVEVLRCTSPEAYFDIELLVEQENSEFPKDELRRELAVQVGREPGVVVQVRVLRVREFREKFPDVLPVWTADWQPREPGDKFLFFRTPQSRAGQSCDAFPPGKVLQAVPSHVCCDNGRGDATGCWLRLPTYEPLPGSLRDQLR